MPSESKEDILRPGFHRFEVPTTVFEVPTRYELIKQIGMIVILIFLQEVVHMVLLYQLKIRRLERNSLLKKYQMLLRI